MTSSVLALRRCAYQRKELPVGGKHESEDDKRVAKIQGNGERPKDRPLPEEDPSGKHAQEDDEK